MRLATIVGLAFALFVVNVVAGWPMTLATAALFAVVAIGMRVLGKRPTEFEDDNDRGMR